MSDKKQPAKLKTYRLPESLTDRVSNNVKSSDLYSSNTQFVRAALLEKCEREEAGNGSTNSTTD